MPLTNAEKLVEAEAAYHELMTGTKAVVFVDQNGERIEYSRASIANLRQYINELKAAIAGKPSYPGPAGAFF